MSIVRISQKISYHKQHSAAAVHSIPIFHTLVPPIIYFLFFLSHYPPILQPHWKDSSTAVYLGLPRVRADYIGRRPQQITRYCLQLDSHGRTRFKLAYRPAPPQWPNPAPPVFGVGLGRLRPRCRHGHGRTTGEEGEQAVATGGWDLPSSARAAGAGAGLPGDRAGQKLPAALLRRRCGELRSLVSGRVGRGWCEIHNQPSEQHPTPPPDLSLLPASGATVLR